MPVTLETRENGRVQYYRLTDPWKVGELTSLYPIDHAYRNTVNFKVHSFMDLTGSTQVPPGVLGARQGSPAFENHNSGQLVVVGAGNFAKIMSEMVLRLARYSKARFFNTSDEGWDYLRQWIAEHPDQEKAAESSLVSDST